MMLCAMISTLFNLTCLKRIAQVAKQSSSQVLQSSILSDRSDWSLVIFTELFIRAILVKKNQIKIIKLQHYSLALILKIYFFSTFVISICQNILLVVLSSVYGFITETIMV